MKGDLLLDRPLLSLLTGSHTDALRDEINLHVSYPYGYEASHRSGAGSTVLDPMAFEALRL